MYPLRDGLSFLFWYTCRLLDVILVIHWPDDGYYIRSGFRRCAKLNSVCHVYWQEISCRCTLVLTEVHIVTSMFAPVLCRFSHGLIKCSDPYCYHSFINRCYLFVSWQCNDATWRFACTKDYPVLKGSSLF